MEGEEKTNTLDVSAKEESLKHLTANGHICDKELFKDLKNAENLTNNSETDTKSNVAGNENLQNNDDEGKEINTISTVNYSCGKGSDNNNDKEIVENEENDMTLTKVDGIMNEPDTKKIKIEPNVIKSQTVETSLNESEISDSIEEDISDDAMVMRHERALTEERRKFQTYLKFPWSTRSRANRRIDSRAESSGANTPDPSSPASHTPCVVSGDQEVTFLFSYILTCIN